MRWCSLHHHSTFSFMDGFEIPEKHVERCAELEIPAMALTEHGNVSSHVRLEKAAGKAGIKPLFGCELYTGPEDMRDTANKFKWHLTVLAMNAVGYRNLLEIVSRAWKDGFYYEPTVSGSMLAEYSEGLIVLSGCTGSKLACDLLGGKGVPAHAPDIDAAYQTAASFKDLLGDRYYLEAQAFPELERSRLMNSAYGELSRRLSIPIVATGDIHYPHPEDSDMQLILHAAGRGMKTVEKAAQDWEYDIKLTFPTSDRYIIDRMVGTGLDKVTARRAVYQTEEIAARCNVELPKVEPLRYPLKPGETTHGLVWEWLRRGWAYRWQDNRHMRQHESEYAARVKYEMNIIEEKDFVDYFLMLSDAVRFAKDAGTPVGPARGSAAASLVCYLLRITEIDPMQFPLMMFERFVDLNREDLPDVDLDFDDELRDTLRLHLIDMYGSERVGNIGTFTRYKGKNSIDDVARVNSIPEWEIKALKNLVVERSGGDSRADATLEDTIAMFPQAQAVMDKFPVLKNAMRLEGNYRGMSVHAAGLVVSNRPLHDYVATYTRMSGGRELQVVSVDKYDAFYLGLLKADFLGLTTMGMIRLALGMIGMTLDELYALPLDDRVTMRGFTDNDVTGIFQFTGGATRIVNHMVKPNNFLELCDINAMSRPGPLHSGATQMYVDVKHGRARADLVHPVFANVTKATQHQIIYQEQILQLVREVGGFNWTHAAEIRKIISQKFGDAALHMSMGAFMKGAKELHGMSEETAAKIWKQIGTAGTYAFNIAHSVSYSLIAYWSMWIKQNYPLEFYAACLRKCKPDSYDQFLLLRDAMRHDIYVKPPDLNLSGANWVVDKNGEGLLAGYTQVRGIAGKLAKIILADRDERGSFKGWGNLDRVKGIGAVKAATIQDFANSEDPFKIYSIDRKINKVKAAIKNKEIPLPTPTHTAQVMRDSENKKLNVVFVCIPKRRNPQDVVEDERARTGEDYEVILSQLKDPHLTKKMAVEVIDDTDQTVYLRFDRYRFPRFERALWDSTLDEDVWVVKGIKSSGFGTQVLVRELWIIDGKDL